MSRLGRLARLLASRRAWDPQVWKLLLGMARSGVARVGGVEIAYDVSSVIGRALLIDGAFEEPEIRFFLERLRRHDRPVVLDVGANIGVHTLQWAAGCPSARVYAFEPSPATRDVLERNIVRNGLQERVTVVPLAVSHQPGQACFYHSQDAAFSSLRDTKRHPVADSLMVEVTTLDAFAEATRLDGLALVKIDVEGLEDEVIRGAAAMLARLRPELFVEIYGGSGFNPDPTATVHRICALGYRAFVLKHGAPVPFERHSDDHYNYYFTPTP